MRRWYATGLSTAPPSYTISPTWKETILIDTTKLGVSETPADAVDCTLIRLSTLEALDVTISASMSADDAAILIDAAEWEVVKGEDYELRTDLTFGAETITRTTVLEVR